MPPIPPITKPISEKQETEAQHMYAIADKKDESCKKLKQSHVIVLGKLQ